jgi:hypothetical protein
MDELIVTIDSLVLSGLSRGDAERVRAAMSAELQRLMTENGLPRDLQLQPGAGIRLNVRMDTTAPRPEVLGQQAARALYEKLG